MFTDHRALQFLFTQRDASTLLTRWFDELMEFTFDITHIPGVANILPDALSRIYPVPARQTDNAALPSLLPLQLLPESKDLLEAPAEDKRQEILVEAHAFGHLGAVSVVNRVKEQGFFWPTLSRDAESLVSGCQTC